MPAALYGTKCDGINHQPRLEARLDGEEATDLVQHSHSLTSERVNGCFEPKIL
jgi:hypothetical protein